MGSALRHPLATNRSPPAPCVAPALLLARSANPGAPRRRRKSKRPGNVKPQLPAARSRPGRARGARSCCRSAPPLGRLQGRGSPLERVAARCPGPVADAPRDVRPYRRRFWPAAAAAGEPRELGPPRGRRGRAPGRARPRGYREAHATPPRRQRPALLSRRRDTGRRAWLIFTGTPHGSRYLPAQRTCYRGPRGAAFARRRRDRDGGARKRRNS